MQRIALTTGEPAGIGPDLTVMLAQQAHNEQLVAIGSRTVLTERAASLSLPLTLHEFDPHETPASCSAGELFIHDIATDAPVTAGKLDTANAAYVLKTLDEAAEGCAAGRYNAMVTAPVHKGVINDAGISFTGHTEYLAQKSTSDPVMLLAAGEFRVALATTHLPLSEVASSITDASLRRVLLVLHADLISKFNIPDPHILICGLNPHAGEQGHLGREEIDIIEPSIAQLKKEGLRLTGPLPADTLFTPQHLDGADAVLAMFHDQGLPVLKYAGFGNSVNITLGLPIIRTSVDHGTALDKAGSGNIDSGSLQAALKMATNMATNKASASLSTKTN